MHPTEMAWLNLKLGLTSGAGFATDVRLCWLDKVEIYQEFGYKMLRSCPNIGQSWISNVNVDW